MTIPAYIKASIIFIGIFVFTSILSVTQEIIVPIIYATIIAIVLRPMVDLLCRKGFNRTIAITTTVVTLVLITLFVVALLSVQIVEFSDSFPKLIQNFNKLLDQSVLWVSQEFNISTGNINNWISKKNADFMTGTSDALGQTIINTGGVLIVLVLMPIYIFMILYYQPLLLAFIHDVFKSNDQVKVNEVLSDTKKIIHSYLFGLLIEAFIIAILNSTALLIIGVDYAILLGIFGAIINVIPYIGGIMGALVPMMIALVSMPSPYSALFVLASSITIQFIDNNYVVPRVVASKVKINAFVSIIVVLMGSALWGVAGMFLSLPLTAIVKVIFDHIDSLKPWGRLLGDTMPTTKADMPIEKTNTNINYS